MHSKKSNVARASYGGAGGMAKRFVQMLDLGLMPDRRTQKHKRQPKLTEKDARLK